MSRRRNKVRQKARRARKLRELEAQEKAAEELRANPTPINHARLLQVFSTMSFRSHEKGGTKPFKGFVLGPHVEAKSPEELVERTDEAHVEQALKQQPS